MERYAIGLVGWGVVGGGVLDVLANDGELLRQRCGLDFFVKTIVDKDLQRERRQKPSAILHTDAAAVLQDPDIQTVIELVGGTGFAKDFVINALQAGKHVVTANKALLAKHGEELFSVASKCKRSIAFEAAVAGGIPVIAALRDGLVANRIDSIHAILNGTSNYILSKMDEDGLAYDAALKQAQQLGYAEADPTLDVNGHDAAHKLAILARIAFVAQVDFDSISVEGIQDVSADDIASAKRLGCRIKLLAVARKQKRGIELRVAPTLVPNTAPLAGISANYNAVRIDASNAGPTFLVGQGAGALPTASAVLSDVVDIASGRYQETANRFKFLGRLPKLATLPRDDEFTAHYARFTVRDETGVLAGICQRLSRRAINLMSIHQSRSTTDGAAVIELTTHPARQRDFQTALEDIDSSGLTSLTTRTFRMMG